MATDKLFSVAGVSRQDGEMKIRFANDVMRVKVLAKNQHTDILLVELPNEMTKIEAAKFIGELDEFQGADAQTAIAEYLAKHDRQPKAKVEVKKAVKKATKAKDPAVTQAEPADAELVNLDDLEDAPF